MSENTNSTSETKQTYRLDDEQRVKVLSPGMLVLKRFLRNRLAIVGIVILVVMFLFSFVGGVFMPYSQDQVFRKYEMVAKDYASATRNTEMRYVTTDGSKLSQQVAAQFILAVNKGSDSFDLSGNSYRIIPEGEEFYRIQEGKTAATAMMLAGKPKITAADGVTLTDAVQTAFAEAISAKQTQFTVDGVEYSYAQQGKRYTLNSVSDLALASKFVYDAYRADDSALIDSYSFRLACQRAIESGEASFSDADSTYQIETQEGVVTVYRADGTERTPFAAVSDMIINAISPDVFLTMDFKNAFQESLSGTEKSFMFEENSASVEYRYTYVGNTYTIQKEIPTQLNLTYAFPSAAHLLGTDQNGMDVMTRLMYGGRISLLVGFVVVILEIMLGVIIGGVSGYFGGWVDTCLMRFVDLFNCIPYYPMMIIAGAVMDTMEISAYGRIFLLMMILGLMGWTGIARVVRGQILSLREQDFMVATEATGIRISRRIFRHLIPNVMPLLIVQATMSLGSVIITEATLSFLGLGVKFPIASWGNIINAATNIHVMTNYWFIWVPAGLLIFLTVLGFNFVGDGLRDAFDPKMKR